VRPMSLSRLAPSVLWFVPLVLQVVIAVVMAIRGLAKVFPIFFIYTVLVSSRDAVLLLFPNPANRTYSYVFWWGDAIAILLSLGVVIEILQHLFRPYASLRIVFTGIWIVAVIAALCVLVVLAIKSPRGVVNVFESIILVERSARVLQVCLLIFLISLMSRLGLVWQHYSVGIAAGFGTYAALDLILLELRAHLHSIADSTFVVLGSAAYNLAAITWASYFLKPQTATLIESLPSTDLATWNDVLSEQVKKWYRR